MTDLDFVKFAKQKKHAKPDMEDLYEIDFLGRKKEGISFNDTIRNEVKKPKLKEGELSLSDYLTKNKNKIIEEPKKEEKDENEESVNESEEYSEDKINHFIGGEKNNIDEIEEMINEIKDRAQINKMKRKKREKKKDKKNINKNKDIKDNNNDEDEDDINNDNDVNKELKKKKKY